MPQPYPDRLAQLQNQYQQAINVPQMVPTQMPVANQQVNQGLLWVSGEVGAKSYLVAPNSTVLLMDSDSSRFYLKSADNAGMPSLRIFEYTEVLQNAPQVTQSVKTNLDDKYVTRKEYDDLQGKYEEILKRLDDCSTPMVTSNDAKKSVATNKSRSKGVDADE